MRHQRQLPLRRSARPHAEEAPIEEEIEEGEIEEGELEEEIEATDEDGHEVLNLLTDPPQVVAPKETGKSTASQEGVKDPKDGKSTASQEDVEDPKADPPQDGAPPAQKESGPPQNEELPAEKRKVLPQDGASSAQNGATATSGEASGTPSKRKGKVKHEATAAMKSAEEILSKLGGIDAARSMVTDGALKELLDSLMACKETSKQAINDLERKPRNKKRSLYDASERLIQVKDDQVRKKCKAVLESFQVLQNAANYQDKDQRQMLPTCDFIMACRDKMVPNVSACKDGLWMRKSPMYTLLVPEGFDTKEFGAELEALGKALQKKGKAKDCMITGSTDAFQKNVYGRTYGKKTIETDNSAAV